MTGPENSRKLASLLLVTLLPGGLLGAPSGALAEGILDATDEPSAPAESTIETPPEPAEADTCLPTTAALLVRGIRMFERQEMREGLEVLAAVARERPEWEPAITARAGALLRSGRFAAAADGFAALLGEETARMLARGTIAARDLALPVDPEDVLGLAIARHYLGDHRAADRLYRSYADLVEPTSERAARAYWRLAEMYSEIGVTWGDAAAERAKALAVDPSIETKPILPDLPDVRAIDETEPYTREIAPAPDRPAPEGGFRSLPVLVGWTPPEYEELDADSEWERGTVEILVGENGRPEELALPSELDLGTGPGASLARAAMAWCFEPALGESGAVAAWITFGVDVPVAAADSLARAVPDSAEGHEEAAPDAAREKEGERPDR